MHFSAIQAMPKGGKLRECVGRGGKRHGISVFITDTGVGIKPQEARKLFEPFFSTESTKGTGLGLWIQ